MKKIALLIFALAYAIPSIAQDTVYISTDVDKPRITYDISKFKQRVNVFIGGGVATGIGDATNYRFSNFKHETELGGTFDIGLSYQYELQNGYHIEVSAMFSYHDFYEDQQFVDSRDNKEYLINGNVEYYAGRLTATFGKEFKLNDDWIYSISAGPILDLMESYTYANYSILDREDPSKSVFNQYQSGWNFNDDSGFQDWLKLSIQNRIYLVGKRRGGGLFLNLQTLFLGKGKFPVPFDHPGFWGMSNTLHVGYTFRF